MPELSGLNLMDLLEERHFQLRRIAEKKWGGRTELTISNSEWLIIARIQYGEPTIAEVSRQVDITRQATHKLIRKMMEKGLVEVTDDEKNKKVKRVRLTHDGKGCFEENEKLKAELEEKVVAAIGADQVAALKELLKMDWRVENGES